jgi:hypothetical protein
MNSLSFPFIVLVVNLNIERSTYNCDSQCLPWTPGYDACSQLRPPTGISAIVGEGTPPPIPTSIPNFSARKTPDHVHNRRRR